MPHRPQCLRLKSRRRKCVFWSRKILLCSKVRKILLCSKVLVSQAGQPPSPECVLSFPPSSQHGSGEKSTECNNCDLKPVMKQGAWGSTCEIASTWWKMFLSLWLASFKQTNRGSKKTMENTKTQGSQFKPTSFVWPLVLDGKFGDRLSCHVLSFYSYFVIICIKAYSSCILFVFVNSFGS